MGGDRGNEQGGFDGGTVGISWELRLGKRRPWNLRPGNRGTVEAWVDTVGNRGKLPWKSGGEPGDGKQDWSWRAGTSEEMTAGKQTHVFVVRKRKKIISIKLAESQDAGLPPVELTITLH